MDPIPRRVVCISDTHLKHRELAIPPCHILIHAGDILQFTRNLKRALSELEDFLEWFSKQHAQYKIFIGGNHDLVLDAKITGNKSYEKLLAHYPDIIYLDNSGAELDFDDGQAKLKVWGIPHTNIGMAFNILTPEMVAAIPDDVDILVTHDPPAGLSGAGAKLDQVLNNGVPKSVGSRILYERVRNVVPTLHVFGHIHGGRGVYKATSPRSKTPEKICIFVNASIEREHGETGLNKPILLEVRF